MTSLLYQDDNYIISQAPNAKSIKILNFNLPGEKEVPNIMTIKVNNSSDITLVDECNLELSFIEFINLYQIKSKVSFIRRIDYFISDSFSKIVS